MLFFISNFLKPYIRLITVSLSLSIYNKNGLRSLKEYVVKRNLELKFNTKNKNCVEYCT